MGAMYHYGNDICFCIVHAAQTDVTVQCFTSDTCERDQELTPMTIEDCCVNNPNGLAFLRFGSEICEPCIGMCMPVL